jgi:ribose transport system ATP-binding protein
MSNEILKMSNILKSFNKIEILKNVDFDLKRGEAHALVGENGAGKSTLMKILAGVYPSDEGKIIYKGEEVHFNNPKDAQRSGISIIFQEFSLIPSLTVGENIFLGIEPKTSKGLIDHQEIMAKSKKILEEIGLKINSSIPVENLSRAQMQQVEIAKALIKNSEILIMDEPTAALTEVETSLLFELIKSIKEKGTSIIYITHRMKEIYEICERVTILRDGKRIITSSLNEISLSDIIRNMTGKSNLNSINNKVNVRNYDKNKGTLQPIMKISNLKTEKGILNSVSFDLFQGEVLGITGLLGSGQNELAKALFGMMNIEKGEVEVKGRPVMIRSPKDSMDKKIGLVPENRKTEGLVLEHSVKNNIILPVVKKYCKLYFIKENKVKEAVKKMIDSLNIRISKLDQEVKYLSGGNQQKVVIAKWLLFNPEILILDEPTIGVDVATKSEIIEIIRHLAEKGTSIIVISSELNELLSVSDRILIFSRGRLIKELKRNEIQNEEELNHAIQTA